jgi:hypothetical protein
MFVSAISVTLRIVFTIAAFPFRIFSAAVIRASSRMLYFSWGHNQIDMVPTFHAQSTKGIHAASTGHPVRGVGGYGVRGGRLLTEITGNCGRALIHGGEYSMHIGGGGFLNVGWLVKRGSYFRVYPLIGLGGSGAGAIVNADQHSAESSGGNSERISVVSRCDPLVNVGLGLEVKLGSHFGVMVGIRLGIVFSPFRVERATMLRPYAQFICGAGTFRDAKKRARKQG